MNIPLKYGLLITAGVIIWLAVVHTVFADPSARIHSTGSPIFFNILEITGIALGIKAKQRESNGVLSFKTGVKTGVAIAAVYGLTTSLFFLIQLATVGPVWLSAEARVPSQPMWQIALGAFAGLFLGAVVLGLIYATVVSFIVIKGQRGRRYE